ncbi:MAG TPA: 23S rRNA (uracil(1939)-C(5))-methyltransferase RlmD [Edaphobacter sp.]
MKLRIEKAIYGGSGLAHQTEGKDAGKAIFVPYTLSGELVEAQPTEEKSGFADAALLKIIEPSANRTEPRCIHFNECGGCHYQHADYAAQIAMKREILHETLERAGLTDLPTIQPHTSKPWSYRNRIRLRIAEFEGNLRVGYLRRSSSEFLPIQMCPISAPLLFRAAEALLQLAQQDSNTSRWMQAATELELFTTADESKLQITLFVSKEPAKGFPELCTKLQQLIPELVGAGTAILSPETGRGRKVQKIKQGTSWGTEGLSYTAAGESYWISRGGFFQVNRFLIDELVHLVTDNRSGNLAWDLFAGAGLFSRALTKTFTRVVAVEAAADDLTRTFRGEGRQAIAATTLDFLRTAVVQRDRPDLIVLDPPRAGVGIESCSLLARLKPNQIVYVSCDPVTLGRDLKAMVDSGYRLAELHMIDLFPQTFHLEAVAILQQ